MNTELKAPRGKYRVVGVDTFDGEDFLIGDFDSKEEAIQIAHERGGHMRKTHVYSDAGKHIGEGGSF